MKRLFPAILCAAALFAGLPLSTGYAQEEDKPTSPIPQPDPVTLDWVFDFEYATPSTISVKDSDGNVQWYWYMTYKVTNTTEDELFFDPRIVIQNDAGEIIKANLGVDTRVFNAVRKLLENPLLLSPIEVSGKVFKGQEYARESVAIWKATKDDVDQFKVFFAGIYGEVKIVNNPNTGAPIMVPVIDAISGKPVMDADGKPMMQPLLVRRTRMIHFKTPGTTETRDNPVIELKEEKDVMR